MPSRTERILYLREAAKVKRYHTVVTNQGQDVGQHSHNMLDLLFILFPMYCSYELIYACHMHDKAERIIGDTPWPAKYPMSRGTLAKNLKVLESVVEVGLDIEWESKLTKDEANILKFLDMLECLLWCQDEFATGNNMVTGVWKNAKAALESSNYMEDSKIGPTVRKLIHVSGHPPIEETQWWKDMCS